MKRRGREGWRGWWRGGGACAAITSPCTLVAAGSVTQVRSGKMPLPPSSTQCEICVGAIVGACAERQRVELSRRAGAQA